jgi:hypothetical protein
VLISKNGYNNNNSVIEKNRKNSLNTLNKKNTLNSLNTIQVFIAGRLRSRLNLIKIKNSVISTNRGWTGHWSEEKTFRFASLPGIPALHV